MSMSEEREANGERREGGKSLRTIDSADIFKGDVEVVITHRGMEYRLRQTKQGKLILYK